MIGDRGWVDDQVGVVDLDEFGLHPRLLGVLLGAFKIDSREKVAAITDAFRVVRRVLAPFIVKTTVDMLPSLHAAVRANPAAKVVFVGRDAFSIGFVVHALDPEFHAEHCRDLYLSRSLVDAAVRELEAGGLEFPQLVGFRAARGDLGDVGRAWQALDRYLRDKDLDLGHTTSEIHLVDCGYKGSVQEMLSAVYPDTTFRGHYLFFDPAPTDPHPGSKQGYALNLDVGTGFGGRALRGALPEDPDLTFAHHEAILAVEELLQGSQLSPSALTPMGKPLTLRQRYEPRALSGLNPVRVAPRYRDLLVREGVFSLNVYAVSKVANDLAAEIDIGRPGWLESAPETDWYGDLAYRAGVWRDQVRAWVGYRAPVGTLSQLLDSFVHRADRQLLVGLAAALDAHQLAPDHQHAIWALLDTCRSLDETSRLVALPLPALLALALAG